MLYYVGGAGNWHGPSMCSMVAEACQHKKQSSTENKVQWWRIWNENELKQELKQKCFKSSENKMIWNKNKLQWKQI